MKLRFAHGLETGKQLSRLCLHKPNLTTSTYKTQIITCQFNKKQKLTRINGMFSCVFVSIVLFKCVCKVQKRRVHYACGVQQLCGDQNAEPYKFK